MSNANQFKTAELASAPALFVRGRSVALGSPLAEHLQAWVQAMHDPETALYALGTCRPALPEDDPKLLETLTSNATTFSIYARHDLSVLGLASLRNVDHLHGTAMFAITVFHKQHWGQGYGTDATRLMLDYGFRFLNLYNIALRVYAFNRRAIRAYEKAGFKLIGYRRGAFFMNSRRYDEVHMDCVRDEFEAPEHAWLSIAARG